MKNNKSIFKIIVLFVTMILSVCTNNVYAKDISEEVCFQNGSGLYQVTWDTNIATEVTIDKLKANEQAVIDGHLPYPAGASEAEQKKYKFNSTKLSGTCYYSGSEIKRCPTNLTFYEDRVNKLTEMDSDSTSGYKNVVFEFNSANNKVTVKIKDVFEGKALIRWVRPGESANDNYSGANNSMSFLSKKGDYYIIDGVNPPNGGNITRIELEIYSPFTGNDPCSGTYLFQRTIMMANLDEIEMNNPAISNPSAYKCSAIEAHFAEMEKKQNEGTIVYSDVVSNLKEEFSPYCYKNKKITYAEYLNLTDSIDREYSAIMELFPLEIEGGSAYSKIDTSAGLKCIYNGSSNYNEGYRMVSSYSGRYWSSVCYEKYSITFDQAKLVLAGAGFDYGSVFTAERYCTLHQNAVVVKKPQCQYSCDHVCNGPGYVNADHAGPNSGFDACVYDCDGGIYSQSCINSCYKESYSADDGRDLSIIDGLLDVRNKVSDSGKNILKVNATLPGWINANFNVENLKIAGRQDDGNTTYSVSYTCPGGGGGSFEYTEGCGLVCSLVLSKYPSGCVDNPEALYNAELSQSYNELAAAQQKMSENINEGNYVTNISDSYLRDEKNRAATYTIGGQAIIESSKFNTSCNSQGTYVIGNQGHTATVCNGSSSVRTVVTQLADGHLNQNTGMAVYKTDNGYYSFDQKKDRTKLSFYTKNLRESDFYSGVVGVNKQDILDGNLYFTNIFSANTNVIIPKDSTKPISLIHHDTYFKQDKKVGTIQVSVAGMGTNAGFNMKLNCYYGVYNDTFGDPGDNTPEGDTICVGSCGQGATGGINLIFRPIDLNDNFPNDRNPRWNWTKGATVLDETSSRYKLLNYDIDPVATNQEIEEKGYNIYDDPNEIDYNIILTPENIRNIREYNKHTIKEIGDINNDGSYNYLDYDMDCGTLNGRNYCYSKFLDNSDYITYNDNFTSTTRKDIAICNNAYGQACVDVGR